MEHNLQDDVRDQVADNVSDPIDQPYFPVSVHITREAWRQYELDKLLHEKAHEDMRTLIPVIRQIAYRVRLSWKGDIRERDFLQPGHLLALALISEILRYVFDLYCRKQNPGILGEALSHLQETYGTEPVEHLLEHFVALYPPHAVHLGKLHEKEYLKGKTREYSNEHVALRETALLSLLTRNRAARRFWELFDDGPYKARVDYVRFLEGFESYLDKASPDVLFNESLFKVLRAPMEASPDDLEGQIEYILSNWRDLLPERLRRRLLSARDTLREETTHRGFGKNVLNVLEFGAVTYDYPEPERFTQDADWMSNVVLMAKIAYVWLDQLSKQYQRSITRLDEIPDEELDRLARYGFNGLWLIGLWERSAASREIKQRMGNPEAAASAYSLYDYEIAHDLGGEEAYFTLKDRAWQRGIRLASDMVPNHVGIFSRWVTEHPDWFIQTPYPPFPSYHFNGPDLCPDDRVGVYIEDGYWSHSDAAVVFKRVDHWTGDTRYVYHGNDGTSMPWNDTAQLNYLNPEVREAVIQTILHVARLSPIIRFDAAMTLAKKHYQRLWFPLPGEGGAIPSRAQYSMTRQEFDAAIPEEFWREVVDRVQAEVPDTLLLAEAFWLMEGYFVRTLGMHRVYNSAFMNMMKMEENLKYRMTVKNVLEFSPQVLKRFVNFMNNPDELTAVEQFGKDDKYIGVSVMMATIPGLPMFGHGQIEGFAEKYGMEFRRAYWDEQIDYDLVRRHEREVFPLLRRRHFFSGVEHFAFFDFIHNDDYVDEDVFVFSNRSGAERSLVIYNNSYRKTAGHVHTSTAINVGAGDDKHLIHRTLGEALGIRADQDVYYIFRDHRTGLQYIREGRELCERGLFVSLDEYQYHVFWEFREVVDTDHVWSHVAYKLHGLGTPDIDRMYKQITLEPLLDAFDDVLSEETMAALVKSCRSARLTGAKARKQFEQALRNYLELAEETIGVTVDIEPVMRTASEDLGVVTTLLKRLADAGLGKKTTAAVLAPVTSGKAKKDGLAWRRALVWAMLHPLERVLGVHSASEQSAEWVEQWLLTDAIVAVFDEDGREDWRAREDAALIMVLIRHTPGLLAVQEDEAGYLVEELFEDPIACRYLYMHDNDGATWINKEQLDKLAQWLVLTAAVQILGETDLKPKQQATLIRSRQAAVAHIVSAAGEAGYDANKMHRLLLELA